jgi:hypothetical protein
VEARLYALFSEGFRVLSFPRQHIRIDHITLVLGVKIARDTKVLSMEDVAQRFTMRSTASKR